LRIEERGQALVVWNSLPWARSTAVQFEVRMGGWGRSWRDVPGTPRITDAKGNELPSQLLSIEFDLNAYIAHIEALVDVPALGAVPIYAEVPVVQAAAHSPEAQPGNTLVNDAWQLTLDAETGAICSLVERASGAELLGGPAGVALVVDDPSDTWSHDIASFRNVIGQFKAQSAPVVVHDGPTRRTLRVISSWGSSTITSQCTVRPGQTAIELEMEIDWHEELKMLKLAFPLGVQDASVTASAPYGMITRQPNGEEEPCQAWVDLSGMLEGGQGGLCCITDSKYGYDALDSELRLSILRSPIYAFHDPRKVVEGVDYHFIDQGKQVVRLLLIPHRGDWRDANPDRASYAMLEPLTAEPIRQSQGGTDQVSYLAVQPENLVVSVVKRSEERGELLVRGYETAGTACEALLHSPALGRRWRASIGAHEIFTLRLADTGGETEKLNLLEEPLPA